MNKENKSEINPQFTKILQIGVIVKDLDKTVKLYEERYGVGPWEVTEMSNNVPIFKTMTINGKVTDFEIKVAMCSCFGMEFELIEPVSESPYKKWLDDHGPGIHHLAFLTKDEYSTVLKQHKEDTGLDPWVRGECKEIGMDFSYLDFTEELGFIAEVYGMDKSQVAGHDF